MDGTNLLLNEQVGGNDNIFPCISFISFFILLFSDICTNQRNVTFAHSLPHVYVGDKKIKTLHFVFKISCFL